MDVNKSPEYDFLKTNVHLGNNICLFGLGSSHIYGLNGPNSDLDIRDVAINSKEEILIGKDFKNVVEKNRYCYLFN